VLYADSKVLAGYVCCAKRKGKGSVEKKAKRKLQKQSFEPALGEMFSKDLLSAVLCGTRGHFW
jgi:hypothetical protein